MINTKLGKHIAPITSLLEDGVEVLKTKPKISLCVTARDEEATIRESIESIRPLVDEIVIGVDLTSKDKTREIAKEIADVFYEFKFEGDFSKMRNQAISHCLHKWVMIWDAHEFFEKDHLDKVINKMWNYISIDTPAIGFKLLMEDGAVGMQLRLLNMSAGWKYIGKVHNNLNTTEADANQRSIGYADVNMYHKPTKKNRALRKPERYKQIKRDMGASLKKNPKDIRSAYYLGTVAHEELKFKKAIKYYKMYLKYSRDSYDGVERYLITWQLARCHSALELFEESKRYFQECIRMRAELPLAYTGLAEIALVEARKLQESFKGNGQRDRDFEDRLDRKWSESEFYYLSAIHLSEEREMPISNIFYPSAFFTWLPYWNLGKVYELNAMYDRALECALASVQFPEYPKDMRDKGVHAIETLRNIIQTQMTMNDKDVLYMANRDKKDDEKKWTIKSRKQNLVIFDSIGSFTGAIAKELSDKYNVVIEKQFKPALVWWADVVWFEWGDANIIEATRMLYWKQKIIVRVHGYEVYIDQMKQVNWNVVDQLIFVSDHTKQVFEERYPEAVKTGLQMTVIPNGVDLSKLHFKKREHGKIIGYAGILKSQKNPSMLLDILDKLTSNYKLRIAGEWHDLREKYHFEYRVKRMGLELLTLEQEPDKMIFVDEHYIEGDLSTAKILIEKWTNNIDKWLDNINYFVSTSVSESFSYIIAEAMAKGIKPIIYDRLGVREIWDSSLTFKTIEEAVDMIMTHSTYESKTYRNLVKSRYALKYQIAEIRKILSYDKSRAEPKREESDSESASGKTKVLTLSDDDSIKEAIYEEHI